MNEVDEAAKIITETADPDATIIFGATINDNYTGEIRITVVATGFDEKQSITAATEAKQSFGRRVLSGNGAAPSTSSAPVQKEPTEDLDVPAFLRNKMK